MKLNAKIFGPTGQIIFNGDIDFYTVCLMAGDTLELNLPDRKSRVVIEIHSAVQLGTSGVVCFNGTLGPVKVTVEIGQ